ncbi:MAG: hypothetical protein PHI37_00740 [Candidatus Gracilibacteria bacterium]|nr:hypothetical protein [Candidatus Gracilibacteria bacterium]
MISITIITLFFFYFINKKDEFNDVLQKIGVNIYLLLTMIHIFFVWRIYYLKEISHSNIRIINIINIIYDYITENSISFIFGIFLIFLVIYSIFNESERIEKEKQEQEERERCSGSDGFSASESRAFLAAERIKDIRRNLGKTKNHGFFSGFLLF